VARGSGLHAFGDRAEFFRTPSPLPRSAGIGHS
jgi:hypothetical protein